LLTTFIRDYDRDCALMETLVKHSYDARWSDPNLYPDILDAENIRKLQNAFLRVVQSDAG